MKTVEQFITELGGPKKVGRFCGRHPGVVVFWKRQNSIPIANWPKVIELAHSMEIECNPEILLRMCLNRPKKDEI